MTTTIDLEDKAKQLAGNWKDFECFAWFDKPRNPDQWCVVYTSNRDSGLVDESNAHVIDEALRPFFGKTVHPERHSHWAVGYVDGYAIKVYLDNGTISKAFRTYCELMDRLEDYPLLDEEHHSMLELEEQQRQWEDWGERDFIRALEKRFNVELDIDPESRPLLYELWRDHDRGFDGDSIDVDYPAQQVDIEDIEQLIRPVPIKVFRDGEHWVNGELCTETLWEVDCLLYESEFEQAFRAYRAGKDNVEFEGHTYTWEVQQ